MSEREDLERRLAELKKQREIIESPVIDKNLERQRETIKSPVIDEDKVLSQIMELDYEVCSVISNILKKNGNTDPDAETNRLMDGYRGIEKKLIGQLGLKKKLQEMLGAGHE